MKAITIWQPWASLLTMGVKQYETRSWATSYRGPIAIHAAKKDVSDALKMIPALDAIEMSKLTRIEWKDIPTGSIIATANLVDCHRITVSCSAYSNTPIIMQHNGESYPIDEIEALLGDWTPGRYAWEFSHMTVVTPAIPVRGAQGLWTWDGIE